MRSQRRARMPARSGPLNRGGHPIDNRNHQEGRNQAALLGLVQSPNPVALLVAANISTQLQNMVLKLKISAICNVLIL
ncbi:hypothetical protein H920_08267 [Fukomys damarensis]|uniref:Uncharacterized protein n=1 Tax=Fukomys damarensis TaxID=885580 RepID=A0A091DIM0_FUKDA|nr:hypothetical protein H920_08267 [Fukomys damarensis]